MVPCNSILFTWDAIVFWCCFSRVVHSLCFKYILWFVKCVVWRLLALMCGVFLLLLFAVSGRCSVDVLLVLLTLLACAVVSMCMISMLKFGRPTCAGAVALWCCI